MAPETVSVNLTMHAGVEETKTYLGENNAVLWGKGEAVTLSVGSGETAKFFDSASTDAYDGDASASFTFAIKDVAEADSYALGGIYPASAAMDDNKNAARYKVILPATQNQVDGNYDPSAYIMVLEPKVVTELPAEYTASFRRAVALNKITLTGVNENISKVEITVPEGKYLAGRRYFNLMDGTSEEIYYNKTNSITVNSKFTGESIDVWFCSWGVELAAGEELTVKMSAAENTYTRTISAKGNGIAFVEGKLNTLKISMADINPDEQEQPEQPGETTEVWTLVTDASKLAVGDKVVIVSAQENYALATTQNNNNRASVAITKSEDKNTIEVNDDVQVITLQEGNKASTFAFHTGDAGYLYAASSSSNHLKTKTTLDDNGSWTITITGDVATIKAQGTSTRNWLRFNSSNSPMIFSCYGSGQTDVAIYRLSDDNTGGETPEPEQPTKYPRNLAFSPATATATMGQAFTTPILSGDKIDDVTYSSSNPAVATVDASTGAVNLVGAGTTIIKASAPATDQYEAGEAIYTLTVSAAQASAKTYTLTISPSDFNGTSYAANNNTKTSKAKATDGSEISVSWTSNQVMLQSNVMQWQKSKGCIYNTTDLGTIKSIQVNTTGGSFTQYVGASQKPTSSGSGGYFQIKTGSSEVGKTSSVVITFEK